MKFAIISDVHGNSPALEAVLSDAEEKLIDGFIFVGDYCISNPYPNECIERIRLIENKYAIRGNEEGYIENLVGKDPSEWTDGQMQISYWSYQNISEVNKDYLLSLPHRRDFNINNIPVHIAHSSQEFIGEAEQKDWCTRLMPIKYGQEFISKTKLQNDTNEYFGGNKEFQNAAKILKDGIYIFGHTHIQWSFKVDHKIFINPGSCGIPLDCIKNGVPYTILNISNEGDVIIEERRVEFDNMSYIEAIKNSSQYKHVQIWSDIILEELSSRREHVFYFLDFVEKFANSIHDDIRPYSRSTWEQGFKLWRQKRYIL